MSTMAIDQYGSTYHDRFKLLHTDPDLDDISLEDLPYIENPVIERLPNTTFFFTFNRMDVESIIQRRPGRKALGVFLEDLILILNRGYLLKFNTPIPNVDFILCTSYRHPPRIVQLLGAYYTTGETWPEEDVIKMQNAFRRHKGNLMKMHGFEEENL